MKFAIGAMTVGDILDRGLKVLLARLLTFYVISLITLLPLLPFQIAYSILNNLMATPGEANPDLLLGSAVTMLASLLALLILGPVGTGAVLHIIGKEYVAEPVGVGEAFRFALRRFFPLLGASLLYGLLFSLGYLACCAGEVAVAVFFGLYPQVVILEDRGGMDALIRSKDLVRGFGWRVLGLLALLFVINLAAQAVVALPLGVFLPAYRWVFTDVGLQVQLVSYQNLVLQGVVVFLIGLIPQSYQTVCVTLLYFDLRIRKEGYDLELAARKSSVALPQEPGVA